MKERIQYLDAIKGFAILLVVMGHVLAWNFPHNISILFEVNQPFNVKMGGGAFSINLFLPYAALLFGEWLLIWGERDKQL